MKIAALAVAAMLLVPPLDLDSVLRSLDDYLVVYESRLSELIADEVMIQRISDGTRQMDLGGNVVERGRRLTSEVAFIGLPGDAGWLGFRHVKTVNGLQVKEADLSLTNALQQSMPDTARRMLSESAEHNLGLPRTTNLPNLPLEFLHRRNRQRLLPRIDGRERVRGTNTVRLVFIERMTPTIIRNPDGGDMPSVVRAWIEPETGRLLRAEVSTFASLEAREFDNNIRVEFAQHKALGIMVPIEMQEVFPVNLPMRGSSVANYKNYRRFQTSARLVPQ